MKVLRISKFSNLECLTNDYWNWKTFLFLQLENDENPNRVPGTRKRAGSVLRKLEKVTQTNEIEDIDDDEIEEEIFYSKDTSKDNYCHFVEIFK